MINMGSESWANKECLPKWSLCAGNAVLSKRHKLYVSGVEMQ